MPSENATFHAPATVRLLALATPYGTALGPDEAASRRFADPDKWDFRQGPWGAYTVNFIAGTNQLFSQTLSLVSASIKAQPGEAAPDIVFPVGYPAADWTWHDVPAGHYTLTVQVINQKKLSTRSAPVSITVLP